ncbi:MAG: DinB family protein [Caldilineaceae bacterium]|nr:DinB family protein [Caldilineaceae bacterium]
MKQSELIDRMLATRAEFEHLLAELNLEQMTARGVAGEWSVKDILVHIAWYQTEEAELFGETGVPASSLWDTPQDARNEMLFVQNRDRPLDDALTAFRLAFEKLVGVVRNLSDEDLSSAARFPGSTAERPPWRSIAAHSYQHDREHMDMIRRWMEKMKSGEV